MLYCSMMLPLGGAVAPTLCRSTAPSLYRCGSALLRAAPLQRSASGRAESAEQRAERAKSKERRERIGKRTEDDAYQTYFGVRRTAIIRSSNERQATTDWVPTQERDRAERFSQMCSSPRFEQGTEPRDSTGFASIEWLCHGKLERVNTRVRR